MTNESWASLSNIALSLKNVGGGIAESFNHAGMGSASPLQPFDLSLAAEIPNLRREGQAALADALLALRSNLGETNNG